MPVSSLVKNHHDNGNDDDNESDDEGDDEKDEDPNMLVGESYPGAFLEKKMLEINEERSRAAQFAARSRDPADP